MAVSMSEYAIDYQMPDIVRNSQLVQEFRGKGVDLALAIDDYLMTFPKILANDITSRILCFMNDNGCSLQEGFDEQFRYINDLHKECKQLADKISSDPVLSSDSKIG
jgi:hypothetical protein